MLLFKKMSVNAMLNVMLVEEEKSLRIKKSLKTKESLRTQELLKIKEFVLLQVTTAVARPSSRELCDEAQSI